MQLMAPNDFLRHTREYICRHSLLRPGAKVIVAVSGGADSVALLCVLCALGYDCVAAHCNFHLRGDESDSDMRHVERLTAAIGVDLYVKDFDVAARRSLTGESLEMACRGLRYAWFAELLDRDCAQAVAVGHHREDQAETFFLNLMRGSAITGLCGMRPRQGDVVRPLLERSRAEIEEYLRVSGLGWVNDSTNAACNFARNRVRNRLLPLLDSLFPGATDSILRSMSHLAENRELYVRAAAQFMAPYIVSDGEVDLGRLLADPQASLLLFEHLRPEGFSRTQTDDMLAAAVRGSSAVFHARGGSHSRALDHGILRRPHADVLSAPDAADVSLMHDVPEPVHIAVSRHDISEFRPVRDPNVMYIDARALEGAHRWQLRHRRHADRMRPFGMKGSRLVSDIMADARLSAAERTATWLLTRDDDVLWVVGIRASALFAVSPDTKTYLKLTYLPVS